MSRPQRAVRPSPPRPSLDASEQPRTKLGLGVPLAPNFLDVDHEETVGYNGQVTLRDLLDESRQLNVAVESEDESDETTQVVDAATMSGIRSRLESFDPRPRPADVKSTAPQGPVEPKVQQVDTSTIEDLPIPSESWIEVTHQRIDGSSAPPASIWPAIVRPRPSQQRTLVAKACFVVAAVVVSLLVATEISIALGAQWLDPRPLMMGKTIQGAKEKSPWDWLSGLVAHR
jgi:hypothetical protein